MWVQRTTIKFSDRVLPVAVREHCSGDCQFLGNGRLASPVGSYRQGTRIRGLGYVFAGRPLPHVGPWSPRTAC